jgi:uncharacterized membrane protein
MTSFESMGGESSPTVRAPIEPSVGAAYSYAWNLLGRDFIPLLIVGFVAWLLVFVVEAILNRLNGGLGSLYQVLVGAPIGYGGAYAFLRAARGQRPEVSDLWVPFRRGWFSAVLANLIVTVAVIIGFILLIIPGIFLAVRLSLVPYIVVDEGLGPFQAIEASWNRTRGNFWMLFLAGLLGIVCIIIGLILLIVGSIPATMLVYLAFASLFDAITARSRSTNVATSPTMP